MTQPRPPLRVRRTRDPEHPHPSVAWSWGCRPCITLGAAPTQPAALADALAHLATHTRARFIGEDAPR